MTVLNAPATLRVGKIQMDTTHADVRLSYAAAAFHYDDTGNEAAVGEAMVEAVRAAGVAARWLALDVDTDGAVVETG